MNKEIAMKFLHVLVVLVCLFVSGDGDAEVRCIEREREALLSFRNGLDGCGVLSSWQSDECCEWVGVVCSNTTGHVIGLDLVYFALWGKVGSSLLELHRLHYLNLNENDFQGNPIPEFIGSMKQLRHLYLRYSNFSGIVPPQIGNLTNLLSLDLSYNALSGPIPNALDRLSRIEHLDLSNNMLEGELPKSLGIGMLQSLQILDLSYNKLYGSLPDHNLTAFSSLTELTLRVNNFTGSMPLSLGQLSELRVLDLGYNYLEGAFTESHFIKLHSLKSIDLSFSSLIFNISPDWSPPFQLDRIILGGCNVGPSFPKWIKTQTNFSILDLSRGGITDELPRWLWSKSPLLANLDLSQNQISGTIPNLSSTSILSIDLSDNNFSGPIPLFNPSAITIQLNGNMFSGSISSLFKTPLYNSLIIVDMSNNQLAGEVPNCWENMPRMTSLNLANNSFLGEIPPSLGSLHDLYALQLHGNNLSGELPNTLRLCQELRMIDVGGNELTGEIPSWIGDMNITFLNFGKNRLHGSIPPVICKLTFIQVLDFSINNLSGKIPDCFNNFTVLAQKTPAYIFVFGAASYYEYSSFHWKGQVSEYKKNLELLKLIDFSRNRLSGNIPQSFSSMMGLMSLNLSQNSLTGCIIPDIGEMEMLESLDLSGNHLSGEIPTSLARLHYLSFLNLTNINLSGKIPSSTQLQSFNASAFVGNDGLCGDPLPLCPGDSLRPSSTNPVENMNDKDDSIFSFMQEVAISMGFGFSFGFWGVVASFILKKSWRNAYFNFFDDAKDWFYVRTALFVSKWRSG